MCYQGNMTNKPKSDDEETRGRKKQPGGRKRFYWVGAHCSEVEKKELQAKAAREMPGKPFATWVRERLGVSEDNAAASEKAST